MTTNIATIAGLQIGDFGHAVTPAQRATAAANRTKLQAAFNAEHSHAYLTANDTNGNPYTSTNRAVIMISGITTLPSGERIQLLNTTFNNQDFGNVWFKVCDHEPIPGGGVAPPIYKARGLSAPIGAVCVDGNGPWQYATDFTRATVNQRYGYYSDGISIWECGSSNGLPSGTINGVKGIYTEKNTRGVTGSSGTLNGVAVTECFTLVLHGCFGGNDYTHISLPPDATFPQASQDGSPCWNSGPKEHYTQRIGNTGTPPVSVAHVDIDSSRHGPGAYGAGPMTLPDPSVKNCGHNYNFERASDAALAASQYNTAKGGPGVGPTGHVIVGNPASTAYGQASSSGGNIGFVANSHDGGNWGPFDLYGFDSQGDGTVFDLTHSKGATGKCPTYFKVWGARVDTCTYVDNLIDSGNAAIFHVAANGANDSLKHAATHETQGVAEVGAQVSWTAFGGITSNAPPDIAQLLTPAAGATLSGKTVAITGNAHDPNDGTNVTVEVKVDGNSLSTPAFLTYTGSGNAFAGTFDSTVLGNGSHLLRFRVTDTNGTYIGSNAITVTVANDLIGPTIASLTLTDGEVIAAVTGFTVAVTDASGVQSVKLRLTGENGQTFDLPLA